MAVTTFSPLLGLALPTTGDLSGTWGTTVNDAITSLLDSAVAGTTTLSANADVTLTTTNGVANQARNAVILWTASNGATTRNITAPAQSKAYVVVNSGTGSIVIRATGPTTGVTVISGERCLVAWNGSDFVKVSTTVSVATANGFAGTTSYATTSAITLSTTVTGMVKGNGTALSAGVPATDYVAPGAITTSGLTQSTNRLLGRTTASTGAVEEISVGTGLFLGGGVLSTSAGVPSGVTVYSSVTTATTYTLTAASSGTIEIQAQAYGIKVVLPDATSLSPNKGVFVIRNTGSYPVQIENGANTFIGAAIPGVDTSCNLNSNSTVAGSWNIGEQAAYGAEVSRYMSPTFTSITRITPISATKFVLTGITASAAIAVQGFTINSAGVVTAGTVATVVASSSFTIQETRVLSNDRVLVTYGDSSSLYCQIADVSTIASPSVGSQALILLSWGGGVYQFDAYNSYDYRYYETGYQFGGQLTGTNTFVYVGLSSTTATNVIINAIECGSTGTTATPGTQASVAGANSSRFVGGATVISASTFGFIFWTNQGSGQPLTAVAYTYQYSGGVFTSASTTLVSAATAGDSNMYGPLRLSSRDYAVPFTNSTNMYLVTYPASGVTAPTVVTASGSSVYRARMIATSQGFTACYDDGYVQSFTYVSGTSLTAGTANSAYSASAAAVAGQYDPATQNSFILTNAFATTINQRMVTISGTTQTFKTIMVDGSASNGGVSEMYGIPGANTYIYYAYTQASGVTNGYLVMRGTVNSSAEFTAVDNIYRSPQGSYSIFLYPRYFSAVGKIVANYSNTASGEIWSPITTTSQPYRGGNGVVGDGLSTLFTQNTTVVGFSSSYILCTPNGTANNPNIIGAGGVPLLTFKIA